MKRKMLKKVSLLILITFCMQLFAGTGYAQTLKTDKPDKIASKLSAQPKGLDPKKEKSPIAAQEITNKKPIKIPSGLAKKDDKFAEWKDKKELTDKRWSNGKVYDNGDGSRTAVVFSEPVHVKDNSGKFQEIDNKLKATKDLKGNTTYKNTMGLFDAAFKINEKSAVTSVKSDNITVELSPVDFEADDMVASENNLIYGMKGQDIQYEYSVLNTRVKENIVLNHFIEQNTFSYRMDVSGNAAVEAKDGRIIVKDSKTGEEHFMLSAPLMVDRENKESKNISLALEKDKDGYIVKMTADAAWLADPSRAYPVRIDPEIDVSGFLITYDTFVESANPSNNHYLDYELYTGYSDSTGKTRSYLQFDISAEQLGEFNTNSRIDGAQLRLHKKGGSDFDASSNPLVYLTNNHIEISDITWENQPVINTDDVGLMYRPFEDGEYNWEISAIVKKWAEKIDM